MILLSQYCHRAPFNLIQNISTPNTPIQLLLWPVSLSEECVCIRFEKSYFIARKILYLLQLLKMLTGKGRSGRELTTVVITPSSKYVILC